MGGLRETYRLRFPNFQSLAWVNLQNMSSYMLCKSRCAPLRIKSIAFKQFMQIVVEVKAIHHISFSKLFQVLINVCHF